MVRLSKRIEYALLAMQDMATKPDSIVSAKDVASHYDISQALVAKVLQQLARHGLIRSYAGSTGGYTLARAAGSISIAEIIEVMEGAGKALVDCQSTDHTSCSAEHACTIKEPLGRLQDRIQSTFKSMSIAELAAPREFVQLEVL
ncbi:MAG: Rrf2 family transcriptional regulator [Candidatus Kapabacteria bacterium]|nr:Rrf2 family transcriptional regulator [Candidatus Kapabacteria bacterium]